MQGEKQRSGRIGFCSGGLLRLVLMPPLLMLLLLLTDCFSVLSQVTNSANNSRAVCEWKKGYIQAGTTVKIPKSQEQLDYEVGDLG